MREFVLASNNLHKVKEFQEMLTDCKIITLQEIGFFDDIIEDGSTFLENSLIKARAVAEFLAANGLEYDILADDSGMCVNALNGAPGIYSARYTGDHSFEKNRQKVIQDLEPFEDKSAYFVCQIVLLHPDGFYEEFEGRTEGVILNEERGSKEFCYDCIFYSNDLGKTFGEATAEEKNTVSHRGRAIQKLKDYLSKK